MRRCLYPHFSRLILRLRLLQGLKDDVIRDFDALIMADAPFEEIAIELAPFDLGDKLTDWWDDVADKCLLIGTYKHGARYP